MATEEQIERMLKKFEKAYPADFFKHVTETRAGIGAVLRLLYESNGTVTAGKISEVLEISTARVAVLLKKMVARNLITKERGITDARLTIVKLSELGEKTIKEMRDEMGQQMNLLIDTVGEERLMEFVAISEEIETVVAGPTFDL